MTNRTMTRRSLGLLVLLATVFVVAHAGLAASTYDENASPSLLCRVIELAVYGLASLLVLRCRGGDAVTEKRAVVLIVMTAVVLRLMLLFTPPDSTDINRYVWDGRVQAAGINPYRYIPADPALKFLRDDDIYPEINRATYAPTIYPPLAQMLFFVVTRVSESLTAMKLAMLLCEGVAVWALMRLMAARGVPAIRVLIYLWHPLPLYEFACSGHVDAAALACVMLAVLAAERGRPILAGIALGGATLVKFLPVVIGPALYRRWDWRLPVAGALTILLLYLPYLDAGGSVFGFLGGYSAEEGLRDGSGLYLWLLVQHIAPVPAAAFRLFYPAAALGLGALGLRIVFSARRRPVDLAAALLLAETVAALTSPHYPWYFTWLVPFLCLVPSLAVFYLTGVSTLIYAVGWPPAFWGGTILFAPFLVFLAGDFWRWRAATAGGVNAPASPASS